MGRQRRLPPGIHLAEVLNLQAFFARDIGTEPGGQSLHHRGEGAATVAAAGLEERGPRRHQGHHVGQLV